MARPQSRYVCQSCGEAFLRWEGQCRACGAWNTPRRDGRARARRVRRARGAAPAVGRHRADRPRARSARPTVPRLPIGIGELDRVLGGGLVPGSLVLRRRRAGDRQVDAAPPGRRRASPARPAGAGPLRDGRGVGRPGPAPGGTPRAASARRRRTAIRVVAESDVEPDRRASPGASGRRSSIVDSVQTATVDELDGAAGQRRPGPRGDRCGSWSSPRATGSRSCSSGT